MNEPEIVRAFKELGCLVHRLDQPFDLLVLVFKSMRERLILVEVKQPGKELNVNQQRSALEGWPVHVIRSVDEAIELVKSLREQA
jgi:hypothetical protein